MQRLFHLFRLSRPLNIIFAVLTYLLGAGIARYLGVTQNLVVFSLGLVGVTLAQFSMGLLVEALRPVEQPSENDENRAERVLIRNAALLVSIGGGCGDRHPARSRGRTHSGCDALFEPVFIGNISLCGSASAPG